MTRSKTITVWLAVLGGAFGLHRFYLRGFGDAVGWLFVPFTLAGLVGVQRMLELGQDDRLAWLLLPLLGLSIAAAMLFAIVYALTPDERWAERWQQPLQPTRWGPVLGAIVALMIGAAALMSSIAFGIQKAFEVQLEPRTAQALPSVSQGRGAQPPAAHGRTS